MLLRLENVELFYGRLQALKGISLDIPEGEIVVLLGANGAGKSSTLKAISGIAAVSGGNIEFKGQNIARMEPEKLVQLGIIQVPEGRRIFPELTVMENLKMGGYSCNDKRKRNESFQHVVGYFPILKERWRQRAGTLSGGEQQMLAIARAIMANPKLLMVDEPSVGLAPFLVRHVMEIIGKFNQEGATILLVEQNAMMALSIAHYGYVMELGQISVQGKSSELLVDEQVKRSYLGK